MSLAAYGAIVSSVAIVLSGVSLWLHWSRHSQEQADRQPEIDISAGVYPELPGWRTLTLNARNLDRYSVVIESIAVLWPVSARLALFDDCHRTPDDVPWQVEIVPPPKISRTLSIGMRLPAAGTTARMSGGAYHHGDSHFVSLVVLSRNASSHSLKVHLRLRSSSTSFKVKNRVLTVRLPAMDGVDTV